MMRPLTHTSRSLLVICLALFFPGKVWCQPTCTMREGSTCICDMSDNSGTVDLTPISNNDGTPFFKNINGGTSYTYNPCFSYTDGKCTGDVAVCQADDGGIVCGKQSTAAFVLVSGNPNTYTLTYTGGDPGIMSTRKMMQNGTQSPDVKAIDRQAIITLICDPADHDITFDKEDPSLTYNFNLKTKYACPKAEPTGGPSGSTSTSVSISAGTILVIIFFVSSVLYICGGIAYMRFRHGATGIELIPNVEFWRSFPGLVKGGVLFIFRCGRSEGYDKL